jgi:hypothetical protein
MDFSQTKLTKMEWESIEIPVSEPEKQVLKLIQDGYHNIDIQSNDNLSLLSFMKIESTLEIEMYLYHKYFEPEIARLMTTTTAPIAKSSKKSSSKVGVEAMLASKRNPLFLDFAPQLPNVSKFKSPKKIDLLRLQNMDANLSSGTFDKTRIFEFIQLDFCRHILFLVPTSSSSSTSTSTAFYIYTLLHMEKSTIPGVNLYVQQFVNQLLLFVQEKSTTKLIRDTFTHAHTIIEKNPHLLRFENKTLYDHQKQLFQLFQNDTDELGQRNTPPKMVLYTAPTGTGKTMSPLGLSNGYRIIYICAARHVGLALARSAISMEKRVAFAFGCETAADIRLHYYSAVEYTKNRKTGGIYKVDNSNGSKVEIMVCDVHSYRVAMLYMLAFHAEPDILLYWDEPTISLDLPTHPLHTIIQRNWTENKISNIVLACATLPEEHEIIDCLNDYRATFNGNNTENSGGGRGGEIHRVSSSDCKKSITLLNAAGYASLPHLLFSSYEEVQGAVIQCERNPSLLRYLDVREIVRMVQHVECVPGAIPDEFHVDVYFRAVGLMTMKHIKQYYIDVLKYIRPEMYPSIHEYLKTTHRPMFAKKSTTFSTENGLTKHLSMEQIDKSSSSSSSSSLLTRTTSVQCIPATTKPSSSSLDGILLTTNDAHTLTDGPTIYLVEDVQRMGHFYAQHSHIPIQILDGILSKIEQNNHIQKKMEVLMKSLDDMIGKKEAEKERKMDNDVLKPEAKRLMTTVETLRADIQLLSIGAKYTPNTRPHQQLWIDDVAHFVENAFIPGVDDASILKIMELNVDSQMKLLLLMGIGIFDSLMVQSREPATAAYVEVMKRLASEQKLFLIVASSDYIYGTNYQLCHGFLGKDLQNMTQQKIIQAMGRVGRNNIQQEYTVRFRDETLIRRLFLSSESNLEAVNMCKLLVHHYTT